MSKWEQNAVFEYSEYICLVKRINGVVAQKTLVTELVRCKECKRWSYSDLIESHHRCERTMKLTKPDDYCSYGERKESE